MLPCCWCTKQFTGIKPQPETARVVAVRGFVYLILEQLRAAVAAPQFSSSEDPGLSQASGSQVGYVLVGGGDVR